MADNMYDISKIVKQIAADSMDMPYGGKKTGVLKREDGHIVNDSRIMDGFSVSINGNNLAITYETECKISDAHSNSFEYDMEKIVEDLSSFIKKEYKAVNGQTLTLKPSGEVDILLQEISRVRVLVRATKNYTVENVEQVEDPRKERKEKYDSLDIMQERKWTPEVAWKQYADE